ncbi:MAG: acyl-CoA hydrolase [Candidatus Promineifilaceae bacterium]
MRYFDVANAGEDGMAFQNHKLVLPEHLNQYGYLFGGNLLKWIDEAAWIAASLDYPGCAFVTIAMDRVEFRKSVRKGTILELDLQSVRRGNTSVQYDAEVFRCDATPENRVSIFATRVTLVRVDADGVKMPLPPVSS